MPESKIYQARLDIATLIADADIGLAETDIVVSRQHDIASNIKALKAQLSGNRIFLQIFPAAGEFVEPESTDLENDCTFRLSLFCKVKLAPDEKPEEDIHEDMLRTIKGVELYPSAQTKAKRGRISVLSFFDVDEQDGILRRDTIIRLPIDLYVAA